MHVVDEAYEARKRRYGTIITILTFVTIVHLVGMVLVQSLTKMNEAQDQFTYAPIFGMMYGSSCFSLLLSSQTMQLKAVNSISGVITIGIALVIMLCHYYSTKGKHGFFWTACGLYLIDTLFLIPSLALMHSYPIQLSVVDVLLLVMIHLVGLGLYAYGFYLSYNLNKSERNRPVNLVKDDGHNGL
jgi:hypothetical protein